MIITNYVHYGSARNQPGSLISCTRVIDYPCPKELPFFLINPQGSYRACEKLSPFYRWGNCTHMLRDLPEVQSESPTPITECSLQKHMGFLASTLPAEYLSHVHLGNQVFLICAELGFILIRAFEYLNNINKNND